MEEEAGGIMSMRGVFDETEGEEAFQISREDVRDGNFMLDDLAHGSMDVQFEKGRVSSHAFDDRAA